jgi:hypothetical protein
MDIRTAINLVEAMQQDSVSAPAAAGVNVAPELRPFVTLAQKHDDVDRFVKATDGQDVLYRGQVDANIDNNSFMTDWVGHAENYCDSISQVAAFAYNPQDVLFYNDQRFEEFRAAYRRMTPKQFQQVYAAALDGNRFSVEFAEQGIAVARKVIASKKPYSEICTDPSKNDAVIPLMQSYARDKHGKNIIAFIGGDYGDYGGQNEFVVGDVSKLVNLRVLYDQVRSALRSDPAQ